MISPSHPLDFRRCALCLTFTRGTSPARTSAVLCLVHEHSPIRDPCQSVGNHTAWQEGLAPPGCPRRTLEDHHHRRRRHCQEQPWCRTTNIPAGGLIRTLRSTSPVFISFDCINEGSAGMTRCPLTSSFFAGRTKWNLQQASCSPEELEWLPTRRYWCLFFNPSLSRCPSPILHERTGEMQGGDMELHREREPTLERTRSAGEPCLQGVSVVAARRQYIIEVSS